MTTDEILAELHAIRHEATAAKIRSESHMSYSLDHFNDGVLEGIQRCINRVNWHRINQESQQCNKSES